MPETFTRENLIGKPLVRMITERAETVDSDKRIIKLSFSSDKPIEHWFGTVVLSHADGSANLERLNTAAGFLRNHDRNQRLGKIVRAWIENSKGYAEIKISRNKLGNEFWQDYEDDCLIGTSFGFYINSFDDGLSDYKKNYYVSTDWEPFEISDESIPADTSTGVGRSLDLEKPEEISRKSNTENNMKKENEKPAATPEAGKEEERTVTSSEVSRVAEFRAFGAEFGEEELARDLALDEKKTINDLRAAIVEKRKESQKAVPPAPVDDVANRSGNVAELARSVYRGGPLKAFKGEKGLENAYRTAQFLMASMFRDDDAIKFCREHGISLKRTQTGTQNELGGYFVPVEVESTIIDLRILYGVFRRLANVTAMGSDTKTINRRVGGLTAYPVGPGQRGTKSKAKWDQVELIARKWMVLAKYEDEISEDAIISMADTLVNEMAYAFSFSEDDAGFNGDGSSDYHSIVGIIPKLQGLSGTVGDIAGLQVASGNAWSEITEADLLGVIGKLPQFARTSGNVAWFCSHTFWANVLQRIALAKGGVSYAEINGELKEVFMGKPVEIIEVMPTTEANSQIPLLYGNLSQASTFGDRRGITVKMTDSNDTDFESDVMTVKSAERFDINNHDVGNADSDADLRKAGPIVGLITAAS